MLLTVPGATRPFRPHSEFFNAQDSLSTNVNGQSRLANNVQIEGVDDNHRTGLLTTLIPSAEAIETVNISTSNYDAEFGRAGGAITNVTLRSGTNDLKGSAFVFGNNEKTSAPGYFSHSNPPTTYVQSGFTLRGPIRRNRLFYFGDYQHTLDDAGRTQRATIPTEAFRNGEFSAAPTIVYNPFTGNADGTGREPFPGNRIPQELISAIAKAILANVPAPDIPGRPTSSRITSHKVTDSFDAKVNYQITSKDQVSGRLSFMRPEITDPPIFGTYGGGGKDFSGVGVDNTYSTGLNYTRTWSNTLVMEARGGMNYYHNEALSAGAGLTTSTDLGIRNANLDEWTSGITSMDIGGFSSPLVGFSASLPWDRSERTAQFATVFTKLAGNHTIKFGEDMRHNRDFLLQTQDNGGPRGQFQFRGSQTATRATRSPRPASPTPSRRSCSTGRRASIAISRSYPGVRQNAFFTFIQDKWAVSKQLTIDLGLRHEYYTPFIGLVERGVSAAAVRQLDGGSGLCRQPRTRHPGAIQPERRAGARRRQCRAATLRAVREDRRRRQLIPLKTEFHSLQVKIDRRFANGILFTNSYTLGRGKSFNTGDSNSGIPTPADLDRSWARTDQDRLHTVVSSFLYHLPFGPDRRWVKTGALSQILGGWQVSGFFTAMSGLRINFTASATNLRAPGNTQRPDATGKPEVFGDVGQDVLWFDTSVFSAPAPNTWAT